MSSHKGSTSSQREAYNYLQPPPDSYEEPLRGRVNHTDPPIPEGEPLLDKPVTKSFRQSWWRWVMLFFACCFLLGSYFCYDNPGPIEKTLEEDLKISNLQFNLLYSVYSYPNTVLPIFGGIFLDMIGLRLGILLFTAVLTLGQAIFTIGGYYKSLGIMIAGRVVFGLGGESLSVSQSAIVAKWFKGKELAMAMGLNISISRLGSVVNGMVIPTIYNDQHMNKLGLALLVGFFVCVFSFVASIFLTLLDRKAD
jgi:nitrate/nitrite transporter NarK